MGGQTGMLALPTVVTKDTAWINHDILQATTSSECGDKRSYDILALFIMLGVH
jgi:hypothetical protein